MPDGAPSTPIAPSADGLLVCPQCDALYRITAVEKGDIAACGRCHTVLAAPRRKAGMLIVSLAVATLILIIAAVFFPFLVLEVRGFKTSSSLLDIALSFSQGAMTFLVFMTLAFILAIPALRAGLLIYVLTPLVFDRPARRLAAPAFRLAEGLKPWAMAEVFAIGCAVALVKITDIAQVALGQAFWMFVVLVGLVVIQDKFMCSWSVWNALSPRKEP